MGLCLGEFGPSFYLRESSFSTVRVDATAEKRHGVFLEIIIAPSYTDEAPAILTNKKKTCVCTAI